MVDVNEQQLDLRQKNSWMLKLDEVSTGELAEVMAINAIAPSVINARLKTLMEASPEPMRFIVNVSAMEGRFYKARSRASPLRAPASFLLTPPRSPPPGKIIIIFLFLIYI